MNPEDNVFVQSEQQSAKSENDFFAKIAAVYDDGITIEIDGVVSEKHYKFNSGNDYAPGDIVKILKIRGTYVIEYTISPKAAAQYATETFVKDYVDSQISGALEGNY